MPKISVIVPCCNVAAYVDTCLESLCNQTLADIEIICIDDNSTDNTTDIIAEYAAHDARIRLIKSKKKIGTGAARNMGIDAARGKYVGFVDADDWVDSDFYQNLYDAAVAGRADIAKARLCEHDVYGRTAFWARLNITDGDGRYVFLSEFTTAIYARKMLKAHGVRFPDGHCMGEDIYFLCLAVHFANRVVAAPDTEYHYIRRSDSVEAQTISRPMITDAVTCAKKIVSWANDCADMSDAGYAAIVRRAAQICTYVCDKRINGRQDWMQLAHCMTWIYENCRMRDCLRDVFGGKLFAAIDAGDMNRIYDIISTRTRRTTLFGILPLCKVRRNQSVTRVYLFNVIPVCKITHTYKTQFYVFGILILKTK